MRHKKVPSEYFYFMMNKACGTVCSTVSDRRHTVYEAFPPGVLNLDGVKLHTVGRLDADTEGLLLLTNDGKFSDFLSRPVNKIPKTYLVSLKNCVSTDAQNEYISLAAAGLTLPAEKKAPVSGTESNGIKPLTGAFLYTGENHTLNWSSCAPMLLIDASIFWARSESF